MTCKKVLLDYIQKRAASKGYIDIDIRTLARHTRYAYHTVRIQLKVLEKQGEVSIDVIRQHHGEVAIYRLTPRIDVLV